MSYAPIHLPGGNQAAGRVETTVRQLLQFLTAAGGDQDTPLHIGSDGEPIYIDIYPGHDLYQHHQPVSPELATTLEVETRRILRLYDDYCSRNDQGTRTYKLALVQWLGDAFGFTDDDQYRKVYDMMAQRPNKRPAPYRETA